RRLGSPTIRRSVARLGRRLVVVAGQVDPTRDVTQAAELQRQRRPTDWLVGHESELLLVSVVADLRVRADLAAVVGANVLHGSRSLFVEFVTSFQGHPVETPHELRR